MLNKSFSVNSFGKKLCDNQEEIAIRLQSKNRKFPSEVYRKPGNVMDAFWRYVFKTFTKNITNIGNEIVMLERHGITLTREGVLV